MEKGVLENLSKLAGKQLCQSLFISKISGFIKKETLTFEFCEIFNNTFFIEHL